MLNALNDDFLGIIFGIGFIILSREREIELALYLGINK